VQRRAPGEGGLIGPPGRGRSGQGGHADRRQVTQGVRAADRAARRQSLSKAYSRAVDSLAALAVPLEQLIAEGRLTEIPGGAAFRASKLRKEIPAGLLEFAHGFGLRPEKVLRLYRDLGITSLAELEAAAKDDRIKKAKGPVRRCRPRSCRFL
jgi:hypothetical protein